jgi:UDP-N-acetylenolpyruvoylglucosamine reductase
MIDKYPDVIARCVDVADVISAVNWAREHRLTVAIRGGGHNGGGLGTCDGGLVIDLSLMKGTHVDPVARTVRVAGGCTWGDVDHATHAFGLATPGGIISTTGVGGLTLGGGLGHLTRACGLSIDNLLQSEHQANRLTSHRAATWLTLMYNRLTRWPGPLRKTGAPVVSGAVPCAVHWPARPPLLRR